MRFGLLGIFLRAYSLHLALTFQAHSSESAGGITLSFLNPSEGHTFLPPLPLLTHSDTQGFEAAILIRSRAVGGVPMSQST
jgi:hypothetical protein